MKMTFAVLILALVATVAFGQPQSGMGMGPGPNNDRPAKAGPHAIFAKLNLSEDQQTQVEKMRIDMQKKQTALDSKIRIARLEMQEIYNAATPDRNAIEKKMKEISDMQLQEKLIHVDHQFAVKAILNPEQQKIWKEHMKSAGEGRHMRERMMERRMDCDTDRTIERRIEKRIQKKVE